MIVPFWKVFSGDSISRLRNASIVLGFLCGPVFPVAAQLESAAEVRSLSYDEADSGKRVDLTGVVIFPDPPATVFIQDETAGTFLRLDGATPPKVGDRVRVRGKTFTGLYLPGIEEAEFEVLEHVGLPEPRRVTFDDLMSGRYHYQWVALKGIIRTVSPEEESVSIVRIASGGRIIEVRVDQASGVPEKWVGSEVVAKGLAAGRINARRQLVEPYLRCRSWSDLDIVVPGGEVESVRVVSPEELLRFQVEGASGHRVKVAGVVLASFRDGNVYIRNGEAAVEVSLVQFDPSITPGDRVEFVGFPEMGRFSASLVDAIPVSRDRGDGIPDPVEMSMAELMSGTGDGDLVTTEGVLLDQYRDGKNTALVLQDQGITVPVNVVNAAEEITIGSLLRVTGICRVEYATGSSYQSRPQSISLRLRSPSDLRVLRAPAWWTPQRLVIGLFALVVMVGLSGLWIGLLKRQVYRQTLDIEGRIKHEAALEERQRIAREFHDTLEQNLAGLSLRLDAAKSRGVDEKLRGLLEGSRSLVSRIQTETRNLVSDLRHFSEDETDLKNALLTMTSELWADRVTVEGDSLSGLSGRTVHHLKMIAQEAVANAVKHAGASRIVIRLVAGEMSSLLEVEDNGIGFDPEEDTHGKVGHFGCVGMRERSSRIGAEISWESRAGDGTRVRVIIPL